MGTQQEKIDLTVATNNKTHKEFLKIVRDLHTVEKETSNVIDAQNRFGRSAKGSTDKAKKGYRELTQEQKRYAASTRKAATTGAAGYKEVVGSAGKLGVVVGKLGPAIAGVFGVYQVVRFGQAVFDTSIRMEQLERAFKSMTVSEAAAWREMEFVRGESERLGIQFVATADAYKQLFAASVSAGMEDQARALFTGINEAAVALGLNADQTSGAIYALQQMMSKGKVTAEELRRQLGDRLPGAFQLAAKSMGVTTRELDAMLKNGELFSDDFLPRFAKALHEQYGRAAEDAADTAQRAVDRWDNAWTRLKKNIGDSGFMDAATASIKGMTSAVNALNEALEEDTVEKKISKQKEWISQLKALQARTFPNGVPEGEDVGLGNAEYELKRLEALESALKEQERREANQRTARARLEKMQREEEEQKKAREEAWKKMLKDAQTTGRLVQRNWGTDLSRMLHEPLSQADILSYQHKAEQQPVFHGKGTADIMRELREVSGSDLSEFRTQYMQALEELEQAEEDRLRASRDASDGAKRALKDYSDAATDAAANMENVFSNAAQNTEDELVDAFVMGKLQAQDMVNSILADLARMGVRQAVTGPMFSGLAGLFGMMHEGGVVGQDVSGLRYAAPDVFAGAPRFHSGGRIGLQPGERPIIAQDGEVMLTKNDQGTLRRLFGSWANGGGGTQVNVNVHNNAGAEVSVDERPNGMGGMDLDIIIDKKVASNIQRPGSATQRALKGTFGAKQTLVGRG